MELDSSKRENDNVILLFDEYNAGFNTCDRFNKVLHVKSWSYRLHGDHKVFLNHIFTCSLINIYHLWINVGTNEENKSELAPILY